MTYETQWRATFEDTKYRQELLRKHLYTLIKENRCLKDEEEKDHSFEMLDNATFGISNLDVTIRLPNFATIKIPDLQQFIRCLFEYDKSTVSFDFFFEVLGLNKEYNIEIKHIWKQILFNLYRVFSQALETSIKMSKERETRGGYDRSEVARFGTKETN